jgi:Domain of unknown function (DUF1996)
MSRVVGALSVLWAVLRLAPPAVAGEATASEFLGINFVVDCGYSHRAADDPIVFPGVPRASHDHSFFGNRSTNAFSTAHTLETARTLCRRRADRSAYWVPTLYADGIAVKPLNAAAYYRRRTAIDVRPFPKGLRMIAGDATATAAQGIERVFWNCKPEDPHEAEVPACPVDWDHALRLHVQFPECWDGVHLDSSDHRSHMAYAAGGACPGSHPVAVPSLMLVVAYPVGGTQHLVYSSGSIESGHADAIVVWRGHLLDRLVRRCLNGRLDCDRGYGR